MDLVKDIAARNQEIFQLRMEIEYLPALSAIHTKYMA